MNSLSPSKTISVVIVAGEGSGDRYGSLLTAALRNLDPDIVITGLGGTLMQHAGVRLLDHIRNFSIMGFTEVAINLFKFIVLKKRLTEHIKAVKPDALILIDFPDFNLRLAKNIHDLKKSAASGTPKIFYYVPPQVWIWRKNRIRQIKQFCDGVFPIFRFEHELYLKDNVKSFFAGHPIRDAIGPDQYAQISVQNQEHALRLALLPGSRTQEVRKILPVMLRSVVEFQKVSAKDVLVFIGACDVVNETDYRAIIRRSDLGAYVNVELSYDIHAILKNCELVLSKSGTVNLETAYFNKPAVVIYKTSWLTWLIAKLWLRIKYISLINILSGKEVVKEFVQAAADPKAIAGEMEKILTDADYRNVMTAALAELSGEIFAPDQPSVSGQIAGIIYDEIKKR